MSVVTTVKVSNWLTANQKKIMWLTNGQCVEAQVSDLKAYEHVQASDLWGWRGLVGRTVDAQQVPK